MMDLREFRRHILRLEGGIRKDMERRRAFNLAKKTTTIPKTLAGVVVAGRLQETKSQHRAAPASVQKEAVRRRPEIEIVPIEGEFAHQKSQKNVRHNVHGRLGYTQ